MPDVRHIQSNLRPATSSVLDNPDLEAPQVPLQAGPAMSIPVNIDNQQIKPVPYPYRNDSAVMESVPDPTRDNRLEISNTSQFPARAICYVFVQRANGDQEWGTAFLLSPTVAVTAAHVVHSPTAGPPARMVIYAGRSAGSCLATADVTKYWVQPEWAQGQQFVHRYDAAALFIPSGSSNFANCNAFSMKVLQDSDLQQISSATKDFYVQGYPQDKGGQFQYCGPGHIESDNFDAYAFRHLIPTDHGESGGPVFGINSQGQPIVIGIHIEGDGSYNVARRIDPVLDGILQGFINGATS